MLLFLLSVGLSVTLGMMNFVNLAHCAFAMLGGYVTVTLMNSLGWPFLATLPMAFLAAAVVSVVFERTLYRRLYRASDLDQVPAHHRARVHVGRGRGLCLRHRPAAGADCRPICAARSRVMGISFGVYRLFLIAHRRSSITLVLVAGARIHALRRAGARRGRQPAHGARARHQRRRRVRDHLRARQRARRPRRRARHRDRRPRSRLRLHLPGLRADRGVGRRARLDRRLVRRRHACSASATWPASTTFPSSAPSSSTW